MDYSKKRVPFGGHIAGYESIQFMLADMAIQIYVACLQDKKRTAAFREAIMTKIFCTEMSNRVVDMAVQVHGLMGYMKEYPIERFYRDLRLTRIYDKTNELQRFEIAQYLLGN